MKFILVMYLCSTITNQCPTSSIPGYQFNSHYDCVYAGYAIAQKTYKNLVEYEEDFDIDRLNREKLVVKFECRSVNNV
tara:strand:+ start:930 stop:1163 length:234 start_codon:yes stop_codon:yes gene_type:complete